MYGLGILQGLGVTLKRLVETYTEDLKWGLKRYTTDEGFSNRQSPDTAGIFTVQYPEEKLAVPERFRFVPFLVVNDDDHPEEPGKYWCTACGICASSSTRAMSRRRGLYSRGRTRPTPLP